LTPLLVIWNGGRQCSAGSHHKWSKRTAMCGGTSKNVCVCNIHMHVCTCARTYYIYLFMYVARLPGNPHKVTMSKERVLTV